MIEFKGEDFNGDVKFPLKKWGEIPSIGWDIATRYAIDADNECWADGCHGGQLYKTSAENLISIAREEMNLCLAVELSTHFNIDCGIPVLRLQKSDNIDYDKGWNDACKAWSKWLKLNNEIIL